MSDVRMPRDPAPASEVAGRAAADRHRLERILAEESAPARGPVRRRSRALIWAGASCALVVGAGAAIVATIDRGSDVQIVLGGDSPTGPPLDASPGEWGIEATLRIAPAPGSSLTGLAAAERLAGILRDRSARPTAPSGFPFPDVDVLSMTADGVRVRVQSARETEELREVSVAHVAVYSRRAIVAELTNVTNLKRTLARLPRGARPARTYFYGNEGPRPVMLTGERFRVQLLERRVQVPISLRLLQRVNANGFTTGYLLLREPPLVSGDDVVGAAPAGSHARLSLTPAATRRLERRRGERLIVAELGVVDRVLDDARSTGRPAVVRPGALLVPGAPSGLAWLIEVLRAGGLAGTVTVAEARRYGTPPSRVGFSVSADAVPAPAMPSSVAIPPWDAKERLLEETLLRVLRIEGAGGAVVAIDSALDTKGAEYYKVATSGPASEASGAIVLERSIGGRCVLDVQGQRVTVCGGQPASARTGSDGLLAGRVHPAVTTVELRAKNGARRGAALQNGWFLVTVPRGFAADRITARDAAGQVVAEAAAGHYLSHP